LKVLTEAANPPILENELPGYFFKVGIFTVVYFTLHYLPGYWLKPDKGSSKVIYYNMRPRYYFGPCYNFGTWRTSQWLQFVYPW